MVNVCCGECLWGCEIFLKMFDFTRSVSCGSFSRLEEKAGVLTVDAAAAGNEGVPERDEPPPFESWWCLWLFDLLDDL